LSLGRFLERGESRKCLLCFGDNIIDRQGSSADATRIAAVVASDFRFSYFGTAAFAVRLLRLSN